MEAPHLFAYLNYRIYLDDLFKYLQEQKDFTTRDFAKLAGFGSHTYLRSLVKGEKNLSIKRSKVIAHRLGLVGNEIDYFVALIEFNHSSGDQKDKALQNLMTFREFRKHHTLAEAEYECFSHWYVLATYELLGTRFAQKSFSKMAEALNISENELFKALEILEKLGLIEKKGRQITKKFDGVQTTSEVRSIHIRNYHREMMSKSLEALEKLETHERFFSALTLPANEKSQVDIRLKIEKFLLSLRREYGDPEVADGIYHLHIQLIPLAKI